MALLQSEVRRLEGDLDTVRRERDALQLEMSLVQVSPGSSKGCSVVGKAGLSTHRDLGGHGRIPVRYKRYYRFG